MENRKQGVEFIHSTPSVCLSPVCGASLCFLALCLSGSQCFLGLPSRMGRQISYPVLSNHHLKKLRTLWISGYASQGGTTLFVSRDKRDTCPLGHWVKYQLQTISSSCLWVKN